MVDFAALPPEINSGLMYAGPGPGSMLAAAAAWEGLAADLQSTASAYGAVVTSLIDGPWQGPSAASMAAAAAPQIAWLSNTASQAQESAAQAVAAASAYEAAFMATVPPVEVAANRALLMTLLATNFLGQNSAAIAATEAQYAEMWAQDATAMYGYSGASAAATTLPAFDLKAISTNLSGVSAQLSAAFNAANGAATAQGLYEVPKTLSRLAGMTNEPAWASNPLSVLGLTGHTWNSNGDGIIVNGLMGDLVEGITGSATVDASTGFDAFIRLVSPVRLFSTAFKDIEGIAQTLVPAAKAAEGAAKAAVEALPAAIPNVGGLGGIAAAAGNAAKVGAFSAPASWAGSIPGATPINVALNGLASGAAAEPAASAFGGMPILPGAGSGRSVANFAAPRYGFKPTVMAQPPLGG